MQYNRTYQFLVYGILVVLDSYPEVRGVHLEGLGWMLLWSDIPSSSCACDLYGSHLKVGGFEKTLR